MTHHYLLNLCRFVHFFEAVYADAYSLVVSELGDLNKVLGALPTDGRATLATVMLTLPEAVFDFADEAGGDFSAGPERTLSDLKVLD